MKQALSLHQLVVPVFLPGITVSPSPTNHVPVHAMQLSRFNAASWERFGEVIQGSDI